MKFHRSQWGANQISLDFAGLRKWISLNDFILPDTRRYLLLMDSLRYYVLFDIKKMKIKMMILND